MKIIYGSSNKAKLAVDSDIVIAGSTPTDDYIKERLKQDKITFRYYARIFYNGVLSIFDFENSKKVYDRHLKYKKNKNLYLFVQVIKAKDGALF